MKTLTATQPFVALIASGLKKFETRSWKTSYRGPIASLPKWTKVWAAAQGIDLAGVTQSSERLTLGAIIATAELTDIISTDEARLYFPRAELRLGFYGPGRWAWHLKNIRKLETPHPIKGALSLWECGEAVGSYCGTN